MASAVQTARAGIEERLSANWTTTEIAWPGQDFDPGDDPWVRSTVLFGGAQMLTHSSSGYNNIDGIYVLDLYGRKGVGMGALYGYADTLRDLFDRATVGSVEFHAASGPRSIPEDAWERLSIEIPFTLEEAS